MTMLLLAQAQLATLQAQQPIATTTATSTISQATTTKPYIPSYVNGRLTNPLPIKYETVVGIIK